MSAKLEWEQVGSVFTQKVVRAKVPGGWFVVCGNAGAFFYPDPEHRWLGGSSSYSSEEAR